MHLQCLQGFCPEQLTERMELTLIEIEKTAGCGGEITRGSVLNIIILNCLLDIVVEKSYRQFIYNLEFSEEVWFRNINWEIIRLQIVYKP